MRRFKSMQQAQHFLAVPTAVHNLFNPGRHHISARKHRFFQMRAIELWNYATE